MDKKTIILTVIILTLVMVVTSYNSLVSLDESVSKAWSEVENQMQRRVDLIPNLVETVKGYASHEEEIFKSIAKARSGVQTAETQEDIIKSNNELTQALNGLKVIVEDNPEINANENFKELQVQLEGTENRMTYSRTVYNDNVVKYNKKIKRFPTNILANMFNFRERPYFEADTTAYEKIEVRF